MRQIRLWVSLATAALSLTALLGTAEEPDKLVVTVHSDPIHSGRISPLLFGNFIELLDDVVPGMWAEMINDRSFEGVEPMLPGNYFDGTPDFCDRPWDRDDASWAYDQQQPFNGLGCAKLTATPDRPAGLTQSGLAVKSGMTYQFTGYFRAEGASLSATVTLKTLLPNGSWMTLATAPLPDVSGPWRRFSVSMTSGGATDRAVFELNVRGQGHVWADKLSLMPKDNVRGWRRDVIGLVRELHPPIVRWGGSMIDPGGYQWKSGIGNRDMRTPFKNKVWGRIDSNDVGIDEFCQFCEAVGAIPLLCVSFGDGAESAGELVQYCNGDAASSWGAKRAANGHTKPYGVKYWQVGNEIEGNNPAYLAHIEDFIHAIKNADPAAQMMSSYPAQELLNAAGKDLAFVCPHEYTRDFAKIDSSLRTVSEMIDATPGCGHLKIAITEWNVSGGDWGLRRARQMTLETALLNARQLHLMMRHSDKVAIATRSNMANSFCGATFETNPAGVLKRPSHFVMELYNRHARPIPLQVEGTPEGLDVFACASDDKRTVAIFAVNSETKPISFRLHCAGFDKPLNLTGAEAVCDTRDSRQLDAMNHWVVPDRVRTVKLEPADDSVILPALSATAMECKAVK